MLNPVDIAKSTGFSFLVGLALLAAGCGGNKKPIVVGAKSTTGQGLIGEITAQHLEHRLGRKVGRSFNLGNTALAYQSLVSGEVSLYPEETGTIQAVILKEPPSADAAQSLERGRNEILRLAQAVVLDPLGIDDGWRVWIKKDEASKNNLQNLSDAEEAKPGWKMGVTREFNERTDGLANLNKYRLPLAALPRVADAGTIYGALDSGELNMAVGLATDGQPVRHADWTSLNDDKKVFPAYQTCILVRSDILASDPKIKSALAELSAKFSNEALAKLAAEVDVDHKKLAEVAAEFLAQAGLK
jgi:glycine betaine/choline ABC-type transport system substrate-binding protein